jgi:hypothetical protein
MTRTAITKLTATALAVASLGLASSAQAAEQSIAIGEPVPGSGVPTQPAQPSGGDGDYHGPEDGSQAQATKRPKTCQELFEMGFRVHCPGGPQSRPGEHPKPHPVPHRPDPHKPDYHKPVHKETKPVTYEKAEPSKGSLPFTGLEMWQLGLIGVVLAGGGLGARRLLAA